MAHLRLTLACGPYDRTQALRDGTIRPEGIELNYVTLQPAEIFWRMLQYKEFDASEMSLSNYTTLVSGGQAPFGPSRSSPRVSSATATSSSTPRRASKSPPTSRASAAV